MTLRAQNRCGEGKAEQLEKLLDDRCRAVSELTFDQNNVFIAQLKGLLEEVNKQIGI